MDGTGLLTYPRPHCPHCLEMTVNGVTRFYHNVLEAKLITPSGLALSVGTEFVENASPGATQAGLRACGLLPPGPPAEEGLPAVAPAPGGGRALRLRPGL